MRKPDLSKPPPADSQKIRQTQDRHRLVFHQYKLSLVQAGTFSSQPVCSSSSTQTASFLTFFLLPPSCWSDEHNYTSTAGVDMCRLLPLPACWFGCSNSPLCPLLPLLASFHTSLVKLEHNWRASAYVPVRRLCRGTSSISSESLNQCGSSRSRGRLCKEAPLSSTASG